METKSAIALSTYGKHVCYVDKSTDEEVQYDYVALYIGDKQRIVLYGSQLRQLLDVKGKAALMFAGIEKFALVLEGATLTYTETKVNDAEGESIKYNVESISILDDMKLIDRWFENFLG